MHISLFRPKSRLFVYGTLWVIGTIILVLDYFSPFRGGVSYAQFWVGILFCMIPAIFLLLDDAFSWRGKAFVLFIWGATLYLPKVLRSPFFFNFQDEIMQFQTLKLIYESGTVAINPTISGIFMEYPGLEILDVSLKSVTGLSLFSTGVLLIGLIHSLAPVFIFLTFKRITTSDRLAAIGAFVFTCNPSYFFFDSLFSYESLGILFVVILVFLVSVSYSAQKRLLFSCLSLVVMSGLVITHHFSSYMFLLFLAILVIVQFYEKVISKKIVEKKSFAYFLILTATFVFVWQVYGAPTTLEYFSSLLTYRIDHILGFFTSGAQRVLFSNSPLPNYEILINYLYFPLILLLSGIGVYFVRRNRLRSTLIFSFIVYGPLLTFLMIPLILTYGEEIAYRSFPFLFIGVSLMIAYAVKGMIRQKNPLVKVFVLIAVIFIAIGAISLRGDDSGRFAGSSNLASGPPAITSDVVYASNWFEQEFGRYNNLIGDRTVNWVFGGYGVQNVWTFEAWNVFLPKTINKTVTDTIRNLNIKYIIVDRRVTEFLAKYGWYFDPAEIDMKDHPGFGRTQPLPEECIDKFDNTTLVNKIYSNGNINIFRIRP